MFMHSHQAYACSCSPPGKCNYSQLEFCTALASCNKSTIASLTLPLSEHRQAVLLSLPGVQLTSFSSSPQMSFSKLASLFLHLKHEVIEVFLPNNLSVSWYC